jgi:hypothetical protein
MHPDHFALAEHYIPKTGPQQFYAAEVTVFEPAIDKLGSAEVHRGQIKMQKTAIIIHDRSMQQLFPTSLIK